MSLEEEVVVSKNPYKKFSEYYLKILQILSKSISLITVSIMPQRDIGNEKVNNLEWNDTRQTVLFTLLSLCKNT